MRIMLVHVTACLGLMIQISTASGGAKEVYGAREPEQCPAISAQSIPTHEQIVALVRCSTEREIGGELRLLKDVMVEQGKPREYNAKTDANARNVDIDYRLTPIRGSFTWHVCEPRTSRLVEDPDRNCKETPVPKAEGFCWVTTFGDWQCAMSGQSDGYAKTGFPPLQS